MKTRKIFISVFLVTLIIGVVCFIFVQPIERFFLFFETLKENTQVLPQSLPNIPQPIIETKANYDIIDENNDWENEEGSKFKIKLLETGEGFHGDEIQAKTGETWLGLFEENNKYLLELSKLKIHRVHDPVVDGYYEKESTHKTGKSISVTDSKKTVFLLKNADILKQGSVETIYHFDDESENYNGEDTSIKNSFAKEFKIGETAYTLKTKKGKNKQQKDILSLVLEGDGISQTIHSINYFEEGDYLGSLYWAGDLDRDGKPDFYFSLYFHDNVEYKNLFLSSKAEKGKLVKKVATFSITGC